jgi:hypothetical protein
MTGEEIRKHFRETLGSTDCSEAVQFAQAEIFVEIAAQISELKSELSLINERLADLNISVSDPVR